MSRSVCLVLLMLLSSSGASHAQVGVGAPALPASQTWGTATGYTTVMGHDLRGSRSNYVTTRLGATYCDESTIILSPAVAVGQLDLPDGATLSQLQFWAYDVDSQYGLDVSLYETCQAVGFGSPVSTLIGSAGTFGAIGRYFGFAPLNNHRVNARDCAYTVHVLFNSNTFPCLGDVLQIQKVHVSWVRDVAPPPAIARSTTCRRTTPSSSSSKRWPCPE